MLTHLMLMSNSSFRFCWSNSYNSVSSYSSMSIILLHVIIWSPQLQRLRLRWGGHATISRSPPYFTSFSGMSMIMWNANYGSQNPVNKYTCTVRMYYLCMYVQCTLLSADPNHSATSNSVKAIHDLSNRKISVEIHPRLSSEIVHRQTQTQNRLRCLR